MLFRSHITESYELAMYFMARHTSIDCQEKRNKKGYLFIIGDEVPYKKVNRYHVEKFIGDKLQADIPLASIVSELNDRYDVYGIMPRMTSHWDNKEVHKVWTQLLGQRYLKLEDPAGICELIASVIGVAEGKLDLEDVATDLCEAGTTPEIARVVGNALGACVGAGKAAHEATTAGATGIIHL